MCVIKASVYLDMLSVRILQSERADVVCAHAQHLSDRSAPSGRSSRVTSFPFFFLGLDLVLGGHTDDPTKMVISVAFVLDWIGICPMHEPLCQLQVATCNDAGPDEVWGGTVEYLIRWQTHITKNTADRYTICRREKVVTDRTYNMVTSHEAQKHEIHEHKCESHNYHYSHQLFRKYINLYSFIYLPNLIELVHGNTPKKYQKLYTQYPTIYIA